MDYTMTTNSNRSDLLKTMSFDSIVVMGGDRFPMRLALRTHQNTNIPS